MKDMRISVAIVCCLVTVGLANAGQSSAPIVDTSALATIRLAFVGTDDHKRYLGIGEAKTVSIAEIKAERLIIVIVNSFCTICQADAPVVNAMYDLVENDPVLKGRTKVVGIAPGNTRIEVEQFRSTFRVPFPILPDPEFTLDKAIPENLRAPMVITVKLRSDNSVELIQTHSGEIDDLELLVGKRFRSAQLGAGQTAGRP